MSTKTVKTDDLVGTALDWAVAFCLGRVNGAYFGNYYPTVRWSQGGALINEHQINIHWVEEDKVRTYVIKGGRILHESISNIALVAAMRTYVKLMHGKEIDIPQQVYSANY